jgi:hypothetical protein
MIATIYVLKSEGGRGGGQRRAQVHAVGELSGRR